MIENYLDWAKCWRKFALERQRDYLHERRKDASDYAQGFDDGARCIYGHMANRLRVLQKDIEAHERQGYEIAWKPTIAKQLQDCLEEVNG